MQERQSTGSVRLTTKQNNHRTAWLVVLSIEPVAVLELAIGMGLIEGVVVEVVDGYREVILGVESREVIVSSAQLAESPDLQVTTCELN